MTKAICAAVLAAAVIGPALAQSQIDYEPDRSCRTYVIQRLPPPVRCMAELLGNWSPKPYIDGEFIFRNREEWLTWKDREDYRHWKKHEYSWHSGVPSVSTTLPTAPRPVITLPGAPLLCPSEITVHISPDTRSFEGWSSHETVSMLRLEEPAHTEGGVLYCYYGLGRDRITLTRPAWGRCTPRPDGSGFDCSP